MNGPAPAVCRLDYIYINKNIQNGGIKRIW